MPDPLHLLLDVQDRDLAADQLRHRRAALPERAQLVEREAAGAKVAVELTEVGARMAELQRSQKRLEDEVAAVAAKRASEDARMYSGTVTSPRELQALQEEVEGLGRRQRALEDDLLEVMESIEPLAEEIERLEASRAELQAEAERLRAAVSEGEQGIDAELSAVATDREGVAAQVAPELLSTYERLRGRLGGIAVARLEGTQCTGCHLSLPATELDAVRRAAPDTFVIHEECGRILVR